MVSATNKQARSAVGPTVQGGVAFDANAPRRAWSGEPLPRAENRLVLYAHRGASAHATENTRDAFDRGYADGADGAETDVQLTRDGVPVLFHDETTGRVSADGTDLRISDTDWESLSSLELAGGAHVLPLSALLEDFETRYPGWRLNLELKTDLSGPHPEKLWRETASECREMGASIARLVERFPNLRHLVSVSSFNPHALTGWRDVDGETPAALLHAADCDHMYQERSLAEVANEVGAQGINVHHTSVMSGAYDPQRLLALGFPTSCYTVDDVALARALADKGCVGIFTNDPAAMGAVPRELPHT